MKARVFICFTFLLLFPLEMIAQPDIWNKNFEKSANFIITTAPGIAIVGTDEALFGIDNNGNVLWENEKLKKVEKERVEVLKGSELVYVTDKGMLSKNRILNVYNGNEYINYDEVINVNGAKVIHPTNSFIVADVNNNLRCYDIDTKEEKWILDKNDLPFGVHLIKIFPEKTLSPLTLSGNQPIVYTSQTTGIMHMGLGHLAEYDLNTGQKKWQFDFKPFKLKKSGKGDQPSSVFNGYSIMQFNKEDGILYFPFRDQLLAINSSTGTTLWDPEANRFKNGKVKDMYLTAKGIIVLIGGDVSYIQMVDYKTGNEVWSKPIKIKGGAETLLLQDGKDYYSISKKYLIKIDLENGKGEQLTDKIKFGGNETFTDMAIYSDIIVLSSYQNVVGIDKKSGAIKYQQYYKPPGAGLLTIAQNVTLAAMAAAATMHDYANSYNAAVANNQSSFSYTIYTPKMLSEGGSRTLETNNYIYISTKFSDKDASGFGLARIDKRSGKIANKIVVGDREPVYDVDERDGYFFYKSGKKSIACKKID